MSNFAQAHIWGLKINVSIREVRWKEAHKEITNVAAVPEWRYCTASRDKDCAKQNHRFWKKKNYAGSENNSTHTILRKRSHFGTEYRKAPPPRKEKENQWGTRGLQDWPETGSWWELTTVLERPRLVWTSLAAKFTECTWSLEASFFTL